MNRADTIFALSSGQGRAGVSVFRVSGPDVKDVIKSVTQSDLPKPRFAGLRAFYGVDGRQIDEGLLLFFPKFKSFTGESVAEFHCHGSPAVIQSLSKCFLAQGLREALPGEFTRRAFDNGCMDLTEAEGLADLIDAQTEDQRRQALRQMQGGLKELYDGWRESLIDILALIEGEIDFPDEEDVPDALSHSAYAPLNNLIHKIDLALSDSERGEKIRSGIHIAIIGPPNAGKSTLLNRFAKRDAAIVSETSGTTRDVIDVNLEIAGLAVQMSDTAGLREASDMIEAEGIKRALRRSEDADLRIGVIDSQDQEIHHVIDLLHDDDILVVNKTDLGTLVSKVDKAGLQLFELSAKSGEGFETLYAALEERVKDRFSLRQSPGLTRERHKQCVMKAKTALERAYSNLSIAPELAGDDMRNALHAFKELAGETDIESVLDRVFSRFCIGK